MQKYIREELLVAGKFDVCVTSFEMAIKEKSTLRRFSWRYIIIDEAHRIKNENSLLSKTMRIYNTNYRLLITGTPLQVYIKIFWPMTYIIGLLECDAISCLACMCLTFHGLMEEGWLAVVEQSIRVGHQSGSYSM